MPKSSFAFGLVTLVVGCASQHAGNQVAAPIRTVEPNVVAAVDESASPTTAESADAVASTHEESPADDTSTAEHQPLISALPKSCAVQKDCVPPKEFASAACRGNYPSMALAMFGKHTPWQRLYLNAETLEAVNAHGVRASTAPMVYGEEVIVLRGIALPKAGKLQISSADIDVLRWDGTCATVSRELFATTRMPYVVEATIRWRYLEDAFQEALLSSKHVKIAYQKHRSHCKGSRESAMDAPCQRATEKLTQAIGVAVRGGLALPTPTKLPTWATPDQVKGESAVAMFGTES